MMVLSLISAGLVVIFWPLLAQWLKKWLVRGWLLLVGYELLLLIHQIKTH